VEIAVRLLLPFVAGRLLRPWIGDWMARRKRLLTVVDRSSILLVVYTAFSASVVAGVWGRVGAPDLLVLVAVELVLLAAVLLTPANRRGGPVGRPFVGPMLTDRASCARMCPRSG
jgi:solute carrier family 10 (sodium/bile acid cotransporter), member 7